MESDTIEIVFVVLLFLLALILGTSAIHRFGRQEKAKSIEKLIAEAFEGKTSYTKFTSPIPLDICERYDASRGCLGKGVGVEPRCEIEGDTQYIFKITPDGNGVCINITVI